MIQPPTPHIPLPDGWGAGSFTFNTNLQTVLPIFSLGKDRSFNFLGSGFVIGSGGRSAIVVSAAYVFRQAQHLHGAPPKHHATALPFFLKQDDVVRLKGATLATFFPTDEPAAYAATINEVQVSHITDLALFSVTLDAHVPAHVQFTRSFSIDTTPPTVGTEVHCAGYGDVAVGETHSHGDDGSGNWFRQTLMLRDATILETYAEYTPMKLGQSFRVSAPISSGMSGGPVLKRIVNGQTSVIGVNTLDLATVDAEASGEKAIAQALWPLVVKAQ